MITRLKVVVSRLMFVVFVLLVNGGIVQSQECTYSDCSATVNPDLVVDVILGNEAAVSISAYIENPLCPLHKLTQPTSVIQLFSVSGFRDTLLIEPGSDPRKVTSFAQVRTPLGTKLPAFEAKQVWYVRPPSRGDYYFTARVDTYVDDCWVRTVEIIVEVRVLNAFSMDAVTEDRLGTVVALGTAASTTTWTLFSGIPLFLKILTDLSTYWHGVSKSEKPQPTKPVDVTSEKSPGEPLSQRRKDKHKRRKEKQRRSGEGLHNDD